MLDSHIRTRKVLIVDDDYIPRSLEAFALEGTGRYYAVEAANAVDALTSLQATEYDCAVVDCSMPDMSGIELLREIRRSRRYGKMPVVLVLPQDEPIDMEEAERSGATRLIAKPFQPWQLTRLLDSITGLFNDSNKIMSVEAVLQGFPFPTMILDADHEVLLANGAFYEATKTGIGECYVRCMDHLHEDGQIPPECPLEEAVRTGQNAERTIETVFGKLRVSVYPLTIETGAGQQLYLHVTQPTG